MAHEPCPVCGAPLQNEVFEKKCLIVGEGAADIEFFKRLTERRGLTSIQVTRPAGGDDFRRRLKAIRAVASEDSTVLVVRDSNNDPRAAFREVQEQIRAIGGYAVPGQPLEPARAAGLPTLAVLTLPWIDREGNLESLILEGLSATWPETRAAAEELLRRVPVAALDMGKRSKALVAYMIASRCEDDPSCAVSRMWDARKGFQFLLDHACFDNVVAFLTRLGG